MIRLRPFFAWSLCVSFGFNTIFAQQLPSGATFQAGNVKIEQHNSSLHIHQSTPRAVIDWQSFNVGKGAAVHFIQPSQAAATLNRVVGASASQILGQITAPGQVFITNGNGVYFGKSASIDVGSMIASSFDIGTGDFMNGDLIFKSQNGREGSITNAGDLKAQENGFIALLAPEVRNEGIIFAKKGSVILASGEMIELQTDPANQLVGVRVNPGKWNALVENKKVIEADGGLVVLSAQAESSLFQGLVKNSGVVQAKGIKKDGGRIMLTAGVGGRVKQEGVLDASSEVGRGGLVTVEGEKIELAESSVIDATGKQGGGNILVGGDWQGGANEELRVFDDPNAMLQASEVVMKKNALIDASASVEGDGGTVVLWADIFNLKSKTSVEGTIYAKSGLNSGDGGKVETSGHFLDINHAKVSTISPWGKTGDWLLDPGHIVITTTGTDGDDGIPGSISGTTNIHPTTISTALDSSNITLATGGGNYDLTVTNGITSTSGRNLTLNAGRNLRVNDSISLGSGTLSLVAGHDMTISANITAGSLDFDATDDITVNSYTLNTSANNGTINLDANEDLSINGALSSGTGQVTLDGADSLTSGATINSGILSMTTNQNLTINGAINAGSRTISLNANNDLTIAADLTTSNQTASAIRVIAGKNDSAGTATGGDIIISGSPTITVGGTSGRATFFSGDISDSSGLTALIGSGSNNFRYNADENTDFSSGNWLDLGNGKYAVYREQPAVSLSSISRVYGADLNLAAITVSSGGVNGDTLDSSSLVVDNSIDPEPQPINYTTHPGGATYLHARTSYIDGSWTADPYYINSNLRKMGYDVSGGTLSVTRKTVTLVAEKTYDGNNVLVNDGTNPNELTIGNLFPGESLTFTGARTSNYHVASVDSVRYVNNITLQNASSGPGDKDNYKTPSLSARSDGNNQVTINKQPLTISLNSATNTTKNYDASADASVSFSPQYDFVGLVEGDESADVSYESAVYSSADAGTGKTLTISGLVVNFLSETADDSDQSPKSYPTDYEITIGGVPSTTLVVAGVEIAKAPLTVRANDSFKFAGESDPVGYNGVSYEGFAPNESSSVLSGTLAYNRSATPQAGGGNTYDLTPSGLAAANYSFNYQNGTFTIVPQNQLVVDVSDVSSIYGDSVTYGLESISYYYVDTDPSDGDDTGTKTISPGSTAHTYSKATNQVTVRDHSNDSIVFTVSPASPVHSTGGQLVVGSYTLEATSVTNNGSDFDDTVQVIGAHTVSPKELVPTVTAGKVKIYDGDPDMKGLTISVPSITSDVVAVSGVGTYRSRLDDEDGNLIRWFRDKNVEHDGTPRVEAHTTMYDVIDKKFRVENIALTGADASNYRLSTNVLEGTDGRINQRPILYIPAVKTYDGTDFLKTKYKRDSHNDYRFSGGVLPDQIKILDPSDNSSEKLGLVNNERFFYSYGPHEGSGGSIETRNADSGKINNQHVIGADLNKGTNVLPHEVGYNAAVNKTDSHITKVVMQSDPAGSGFLPQNYVLPGENHPSLPGGFDTSNAPVRVDPKDIKITATKIYDSTPNLSSLTLTTDVTNETLRFSSVTTATEHAGALDASGVRSQTYINNITLSDAADARYTDDASGHNPTGFISDYKFSGQQLWNAANKTTVTVSPGNTNKNNITINPKPISISGITASDKIYNGNRVATIDATGASGWIAGDNVTVSATGLFNTKNVNGNELSKTVTLTSTYTGDDKDNYTITDQATTTATVLKRPVGIFRSREYNANTAIGHTGSPGNRGGLVHTGDASVSGLVGSETLSFIVALADKDVDGPDNDVNTRDNYITGINSWTNGSNGGLANNYKFYDNSYAFNSNYNSIAITPKEVDLEVTKTYDGTTDLTGEVSIDTGVSGESLNYTGATSSSKDVSNTRYVNAIDLQNGPSGEKITNYSLPDLTAYHTSNNKVDINKKNLIVTGLSSADKVYDGNTIANVTGTAALNAAIATSAGADNDGTPLNVDSVSLVNTASPAITATFADKDVGTGITITFASSSIGLTGTGAGNYNLVSPTDTRDITTNDVQISATKVYDGTDLVVTGDTVTITTSAGETLNFSGARTAFVNVNDSNNYFTHFTLEDGNSDDPNRGIASNYTFSALGSYSANNSVTINPRNLRIKANNETKTYGTAATLNGATAFSTVGPNATYGLQNGETVGSVTLTASGGGELASADVGTYTITPSAATGGTFDINNYNVLYRTGTLSKTRKPLSIVGLSADNKVYDGTRAATISNYGTLTGILFSDDVSLNTGSLGSAATFGGKNEGTGKTVTLALDNDKLIGAERGNYSISNKTTTANVTKKIVGLSANRTYDGSTDLTGAVTITTGVGSETLTYSGATASSKNVATAGKYINAINLGDGTGGGLARNYQLPSLDASNAPVTINAKEVGLSANRVYDGTTNLTGSDVTITTGVSGESLTYSGATASSKNVTDVGKYIDAITLEDEDGANNISGGLASNYRLPTTLSAGNAPVTITQKSITVGLYDALTNPNGFDVYDRPYDGTSVATIQTSRTGSLIGVESGDTVSFITPANANFSDAVVDLDGSGNEMAKDVSLTLTNANLGGADKDNYSITNQTFTDLAVIQQREVYLTATKTYDGITQIESSELSIGNRVAGENLGYSGTAHSNSQNVVGDTYVNLSAGSFSLIDGAGGTASNYKLPANSFDITKNNVSINPASLTITADDKTKTYGDADPVLTVNYSGFQNTDDASVLSGLTISTATGQSATAGTHAITPNGASSGNYNISYGPNATLTVNQRNISLLADNQSKIYGNALSLGSTAFTLNGLGTYAYSEIATTVDLSTGASNYDGDLTAAVGTYANAINISGATGTNGFLAANYNIDYQRGDFSIDQREVTLSVTKDYDGTTNVENSELTVGNLANGETLSITGSLLASSKNVTGANYLVTTTNFLADNTGLASNYKLPSSAYDGIKNRVTTNAVDLLITADDKSKIYGDADPTLSASYSGFQHTDNESVVSGLALSTQTGSYATAGIHTITPSGASSPNYNILFTPGTLTVGERAITLTAADQSKVYGDIKTLGTTAFSLSAGSFASGETATAVSLSMGGSDYDSNSRTSAGTYLNAIGISGATGVGGFLASNYDITYQQGDFIINPANLTITADDKSKTYGGFEPSLTANYSGFKNGEDASVLSGLLLTTQTGAAASVGNHAITPSGATSNNYNISFVPGTLNVSKAPLLVTAKDDAKFLTQSDPVNYQGVSYSGFVLGENEDTPGALGGTLAVTRNNAEVSIAGDYQDVLVPSGLVASNYEITYENGDFVIVPSDQLLVRVEDVSNVYGTKTSYNLSSVEYYDGVGVVRLDDGSVTGSMVSISDSNLVNINDGAGGSSQFTLGPLSASFSTSYNLDAGLYNMGTVGLVTKDSPNFSDVVTVVGSHQVNTKNVTVSPTSGVSKVYDATTAMNGLSLNLIGKEFEDTVTVDGMGAYASSNAGTGIAYTLSNIQLSGADALNYYLGADYTASGNDGVILPKTVSLSAEKTYDANTDLNGFVSVSTGVGTQNLNYSGATASSKDVAISGKYIEAITLENATDGSGGIASNYQLPTLNAINAPVTINAKSVGLTANRIYDGSRVLSSTDVVITTGVGSETLSYSGATASSKDVDVSNKYIDAITLVDATDGSGGLASNYQLPSLDANNAPVIISAKTVGLSASRIYDGSINLTGEDLTITTGVGSETLSYSGATVSSKDVAISNKYIDAITLVNATDGSGGLASNYQLPSLDAVNAPVTISAKTVGLSASKIYDAGVDLTGYVTLSTGVGSETLSYSGASASSKNVAVSNKYIDAIALSDATDESGGLASNYKLPSLDAINAPVTINERTVGLLANRIYDGTRNLSGADVSITTGVEGESLSYSGATVSSKDVAVSNKYIDAITLENALDGSGGLASNYQLPTLDAVNALVSITPKVVELSASKIYDALLTLTGSDVTILTGVGEETLSYSGATASAKDVVATGNYIDSIRLEDAIDQSGGLASNYLLPSLEVLNAPVNIQPSSLVIQAFDEVKTYGRDAVLDGDLFEVRGLLGQEEIFSVSLQSDGSGRNAALGLYDIVPSDARGPGFDPNNYFIDYLNGVLVVEASPFDQKTALVTLETTQNKVAKTQTSSVETVDTSTFSTITPTSIGPPPPTFITAPPSSLAVPPSILPSTPVVVPATSVMTPSTPTVTPTVAPTPTAAPVPEVTSTPTTTVEIAPTPSPVPNSPPVVTPQSTPTPVPEPTSTPVATPEPNPAPAPAPETTSTPTTTAEPASASAPESTSAPTATAEPASAPAAESTSTQAMSTPAAEAVTSTQSNADASGSSSGLTVDLLDSPDTSKVGLIAVSVPKETTASGSGFSFEVPKEISTMSQQQEVSVEVTLETGAPLPSWLSYQEDTGKFTSASVPDGAFPITVIMKIGSEQVAVVISERGE